MSRHAVLNFHWRGTASALPRLLTMSAPSMTASASSLDSSGFFCARNFSALSRETVPRSTCAVQTVQTCADHSIDADDAHVALQRNGGLLRLCAYWCELLSIALRLRLPKGTASTGWEGPLRGHCRHVRPAVAGSLPWCRPESRWRCVGLRGCHAAEDARQLGADKEKQKCPTTKYPCNAQLQRIPARPNRTAQYPCSAQCAAVRKRWVSQQCPTANDPCKAQPPSIPAALNHRATLQRPIAQYSCSAHGNVSLQCLNQQYLCSAQ